MSFWRAAADPVPLAIIGGGRWGITWAQVAVRARGSAKDICLVSRTRASEAQATLSSFPETAGIRVFESLAQVPYADGDQHMAIVSSRPRDHMHDALDGLQRGRHVLVEKPMTVDPSDTRRLVDEARKCGRRLGIGTEFALLPALHRLTREFLQGALRNGEARLHWRDPAGEVRNGATKREHDEITPLEDLLPHALSIFRILSPLRGLVDISVSGTNRTEGILRFCDSHSSRFLFDYAKESSVRVRRLEINCDAGCFEIEFSGKVPSLRAGGVTVAPTHPADLLDSTLRLELGAFAQHVSTGLPRSLIDVFPKEIADLTYAVLLSPRH